MSYKVHRLDINMETDGAKLEAFLNQLERRGCLDHPQHQEEHACADLRSNRQG